MHSNLLLSIDWMRLTVIKQITASRLVDRDVENGKNNLITLSSHDIDFCHKSLSLVVCVFTMMTIHADGTDAELSRLIIHHSRRRQQAGRGEILILRQIRCEGLLLPALDRYLR
jgi:hypothetical protein